MTMVASLGVGAGLAGAVIQSFGASTAFCISSLGFVISALAVSIISVPHTTGGASRERGAVRSELGEGLRFLFGSRTLIGLIVSLAVLQLGVGGLQVCFVPFLQDT